MTSPAHAALEGMLRGLGGEVDEAVLYYLAGVLESEDRESTPLEDVLELLSSACPAFCSLPAEEQTARVLALFDDVSSTASAGEEASIGACNTELTITSTSVDTAARHLAQMSINTQKQCEHSCNAGHSSSGSSAASSSTRSSMEAADKTANQAQVQALMALCPADISEAFVAHVLQDLNSNDAQAAADWILDCDDVTTREQAWLEAREDQKLDTERQKQAILQRFALQVVPEPQPNGQKKDKALDTWGRDSKQKQQVPQVRYRDGIGHHTKDKYIVEKLGEEWNGGSTGKVYTKGKRGKGFV